MKKLFTAIAVLAVLGLAFGSVAWRNAVTSVPVHQSSIVPCDTDTDCLKKNPDPTATPTPEPKVFYTCDAVTKAGNPCKRHVREAGLVCWQHRPKV